MPISGPKVFRISTNKKCAFKHDQEFQNNWLKTFWDIGSAKKENKKIGLNVMHQAILRSSWCGWCCLHSACYVLVQPVIIRRKHLELNEAARTLQTYPTHLCNWNILTEAKAYKNRWRSAWSPMYLVTLRLNKKTRRYIVVEA